MKNKKAAMEMSVGTIVTIVLLMSVLVLGIFLIQNIFGGSQDAVDQINAQVQNEINKLFSEEGQSLAIFPNSREITLKQGENKGFAFSVFNKDVESHSYSWTVEAVSSYDFIGKCGSGMTKEKAERFLVLSGDNFDLASSSQMDIPEIVFLYIPEESPLCTIPYKLVIKRDGQGFQQATVFVTIK